MKGDLKRTTGNSLSPLVNQNKDIGAASQTLLTEVKLRLSRSLYGGAIPVSAAFFFARVYLQGLEGDSMAFVWVPWLLVIKAENWSAISSFSDPLLMLSAISCWNFLHSNTSRGSEWLCRAKLILKSYVEADSNQFTTGITSHQLVQWAQCPTIKKQQICKSTWYPSLITRNLQRASQPLSLVNLTGFTTPTSG